MTTVRLVANYKIPLERITPGGSGVWDGIQFVTEEVDRPDFLISFNYPDKPVVTHCPPEHCWAVIQEPPTFTHNWLHTSHPGFSRLYSCHPELKGGHRRLQLPYLHWHFQQTFDQLCSEQPPEKTKELSTITSSLYWLPGHKARVDFLKQFQATYDFDWFGRGVRDIEDKWDGLAPYKYSFAFENYASDYYWTEKISDCFLSRTVPIYWGCPKIADFFPADSMILVDPARPEEARRIVTEAMESDFYGRHLDQLEKARDLVLHHYHPLSFFSRQIKSHLNEGCCCQPSQQRIRPRTCPSGRVGLVLFYGRYLLEKSLSKPLWA